MTYFEDLSLSAAHFMGPYPEFCVTGSLGSQTGSRPSKYTEN